MRLRLKWHRTMTLALAAAFVFAAIVLQREATLIARADSGHWPLGWLAVFAVAALCFVCGASSRDASHGTGRVSHEDAPD